MKTTTLFLFAVVSGFAVSAFVLTEEFSDNSLDYTLMIASGKASASNGVTQTTHGFNDRGVEVDAAAARVAASGDHQWYGLLSPNLCWL